MNHSQSTVIASILFAAGSLAPTVDLQANVTIAESAPQPTVPLPPVSQSPPSPSTPASPAGPASSDQAGDAETPDSQVGGRQMLGDDAITIAVKTRLRADSSLDGLDIHVSTESGVVTLAGNVKSGAEKERAVQLASETTGVKRVNNQLVLAPRT